MGRSRLAKLACSSADSVSGAVAALCAELEEACWTSLASVAEAFPMAKIEGRYVRIPIGDDHCVDLCVCYDKEMVLVVFADTANKAPRIGGAKGRRSA